MTVKGSLGLLILAAFFIGAPLVSYIYLKQGYNYRLAALNELKVKAHVQPFLWAIDSTISLTEGDVKGKVLVLSRIEQEEDMGFMVKLQEQFESRPELELWSFSNQWQQPDSMRSDRWKHFVVSEISTAHFWEKAFNVSEGSNIQHILVDTAMDIRNYYDHSEDQRLKLVQHLTIVLPRSKESDIKYEVSDPSE